MDALVLTTRREIRHIEIDGLQDMQMVVGGWIDIVPVYEKPELAMVVNDCGLVDRLPINMFASILYGVHVHGDPIAGNVLIMRYGIDPVTQEPDVVGLQPGDEAAIRQLISKSVAIQR